MRDSDLVRIHRRETQNMIGGHIWGIGSGVCLGAALAMIGFVWAIGAGLLLIIVGVLISTRRIRMP